MGKKLQLTMHFWTLTTQEWVCGFLRVFSEDDPGLASLKRQRKQIRVMTERHVTQRSLGSRLSQANSASQCEGTTDLGQAVVAAVVAHTSN